MDFFLFHFYTKIQFFLIKIPTHPHKDCIYDNFIMRPCNHSKLIFRGSSHDLCEEGVITQSVSQRFCMWNSNRALEKLCFFTRISKRKEDSMDFRRHLRYSSYHLSLKRDFRRLTGFFLKRNLFSICFH